jgi:uncharacterized protein YabE (DUF348 family)
MINSNDHVLSNGLSVPVDQPLTSTSDTDRPLTLQIRRAVTISINTPDAEQKLESAAFTVGQALQEASISLHARDVVDPPVQAPIYGPSISISPVGELTVTADGKTMGIRSSARLVGAALAEAGIPLMGLDFSLPAENEPLPLDGKIQVVRVSESVLLGQKPIPFESELQASADVPLDQTRILLPGEPGLTIQRIRVRYEDGKEISRLTEDETMVRPAAPRLLAYGTKVEVKSAVVDGVNLEYWRALQMYATSYSPCRSGGEKCFPGTSSGKSLRKGMVGLRYDLYLGLQGQQLYIPGYGFASVEDVCGGCVGRPWIDLGFSDNDYEPWHSWVTVYFLTPVPANVIYILE